METHEAIIIAALGLLVLALWPRNRKVRSRIANDAEAIARARREKKASEDRL